MAMACHMTEIRTRTMAATAMIAMAPTAFEGQLGVRSQAATLSVVMPNIDVAHVATNPATIGGTAAPVIFDASMIAPCESGERIRPARLVSMLGAACARPQRAAGTPSQHSPSGIRAPGPSDERAVRY